MDTKIERKAGVPCNQCDTPMDILRIRKYEGNWPYWVIAGGVLLSLLGGFVIGVFVLLCGVYAASAREVVSCCPKCGYYFKAYLPDQDREE